ncbi:transcriptional regulator with XRE-family HTH domain [Catenulispora sp. MAP5-51]|uniref:DUF2690 domain-containing protein n=1 Tax=Catenulispora sp. MAP5-51 TaxID=3156298 RepID=UPI003512EA9A
MSAPRTDTRAEVTTLAAELRRLRERAGLSFAALGEQTPYSRSAWQRYLTAKVLPPWPAVRDLCRLSGEPEPRLRALWELAESADRGRGAVMAEPPKAESESDSDSRPGPQFQPKAEPKSQAKLQPKAEPEPDREPVAPPWRRRRVRVGLAVALIAAVAIAAAGVSVLRGTGTGSTPSRTVAGAFTVTCTSGSCTPTCHGAACVGRDPGLTLCGIQAQPLQQQETPTGIGLDIRYNPVCQTAWARFWNTHVGDSLTITASGGPAQSVRIADPKEADDFSYTPMLFVAGPGVTLRACITPAGGAPVCYTDTVS